MQVSRISTNNINPIVTVKKSCKQTSPVEYPAYCKYPAGNLHYLYFTGCNAQMSDERFEGLKKEVIEYADKYEDEADLSRLYNATTKENINFCLSLLRQEKFPKHEIYPIICHTNATSLPLAKTLCQDEKFPRYLIARILKGCTQENLPFIKALYEEKKLPPNLIPRILDNIDRKTNTKDFINGVPYYAKMYNQCIKTPDKYINAGNLNMVLDKKQDIVKMYFATKASKLLKLATLEDNSLNDILLRKRFFEMNEYLKILDTFEPEEFETLRNGINCKTNLGVPLTPPEKVNLIELINEYKITNSDMSQINDMITQGSINIKQLKHDVINYIMENMVYNADLQPDEINTSSQKLSAWDLNYTHLIGIQLNKNSDSLKDIIALANRQEDFKTALLNSNDEIAKINQAVKSSFNKNGLNYEKWLTPSAENEIHINAQDKYTEQTQNLAKRFSLNVNELMTSPAKTFITKKYQRYIKNNEFHLPQEIIINKTKLLDFMKNFNSELTPVWNRAKSNIVGEHSAKAMHTLMLRDHIASLIEGCEQIEDEYKQKTIDLTIKMWNRFPQHDLFQGNYSTCCIGMGKDNGEAMSTYLTNTTFNFIELIDNTTNKTIGNALCYYVSTETEPALIVDNIEISNSYIPSPEMTKKIRNGILEYCKNLNEEVTGTRNTPVYLGVLYNDVSTDDLTEIKNLNIKEYIGQLWKNPEDQLYLDALEGWIYGMDLEDSKQIKNLYRLN